MYFWARFTNRKSGTIEAADEAAALTRAAEFGNVKGVEKLPYPAEPQLAVESGCPSFCFQPEVCRGHTSCPHRHACTE